MSGESGGAVVGGLVAISVAPYVVAGAAAIGAAYGAIKIAGFLGKHALEYAEKKRREKELAVDRCSTELDGLFKDMRSVVREETSMHVKYAEEISKEFEKYGSELKTACDGKPSAEELDKKLAISRTAIRKKLVEEGETVRKKMITEGKAKLDECVKTIEKSNATKTELIAWSDHTAASTSLQKSAASEMVRDAEAAFRVIDAMAKSSSDEVFVAQVRRIQTALLDAKRMMDQEMFQGAFSSAKTVVRESAILASEHVQEEMEADMLVMELKSKLLGLTEELSTRRYLDFCDEAREEKKTIRVDLNKFSQKKYVQMLERLEEMTSRLDKLGEAGRQYEIQKMMDEFDEEVEPEAQRIVETSIKVMQAYYDKIHVLEVVADFMVEQGYSMDWAAPVGGDLSQKLVVHFVQKKTGNTISITLDKDVKSEDIAGMAMELLSFYGSGRPVTEEEKKRLREDLNKALEQAGYAGKLGCTGKVNLPSDRVELNDEESVKNLPVEEVV